MITYLQLKNFRRHENTELAFDPNDQLILIAGNNGTGKSTLISEAVLWALYGETRNGKRGFDGLIKRGSELEGMEVTCEFTVDEAVYRVTRRREGGMSTAKLSKNGSDIVESASAVTAKISAVLGMDVQGFKLAVLAQQKELNGLSSQTAAERARVLSRLLRLDAIERARNEVRSRRNVEENILKGMGNSRELDFLDKEVERNKKLLTDAEVAEQEARAEVAKLDAQLAEGHSIAEEWRAAQQQLAKAEATKDSIREEVTRLEANLSNIFVPAEVTQGRDREEIDLDIEKIQGEIALAEAAAKSAKYLVMIRSEVEQIEQTIAGLNSIAKKQEELASRKAELNTNTEAYTSSLIEIKEEVDKLHTAIELKKAKMQELSSRVLELNGLEGTCVTCGQVIDEAHQHQQLQDAEKELATLEDTLQKDQAKLANSMKTLEEIEKELVGLRKEIESISRENDSIEIRLEEKSDLERRLDTYSMQLEQKEPKVYDKVSLQNSLTELKAEAAEQKKTEELTNKRLFALDRKKGVTESLEHAKTRLVEAEKVLENSMPDPILEEAFYKLETIREAREAELAIASSMSVEVARSQERVSSASKELEEGRKFESARSKRIEEVRLKAHAVELLTDIHKHLSTELRPALAGGISELLNRMSEGRFSRVEVTDDYDIKVEDDGAMRPLTELSGGEMDLIALATRLALAGAVSERPGVGSAGFLVLDEIFGSQDAERRAAELNALRNLRTEYGQIFIISHVGGLEDAADKVVEIITNSDRTETEVRIS